MIQASPEGVMTESNRVARTAINRHPHDYYTLLDLYRESSGHRDETLTSRTIDDLVSVLDSEGYAVLQVNSQAEPINLFGARVTGTPGVYRWHLREVPSEPLRIAVHELRATLGRFDVPDLYAKYKQGLTEADALLEQNRWRLVEAVTGATSVEDMSGKINALIAEAE